MKTDNKRNYIGKIVFGIGILGVVVLNLLAWYSTEFSDWYINHIFPIWLNTYARFTSLASVSVGEIMLILAVGITAFGIGFYVARKHIVCKCANRFIDAVKIFNKTFFTFARIFPQFGFGFKIR